jgi:hypothetical protein
MVFKPPSGSLQVSNEHIHTIHWQGMRYVRGGMVRLLFVYAHPGDQTEKRNLGGRYLDDHSGGES